MEARPTLRTAATPMRPRVTPRSCRQRAITSPGARPCTRISIGRAARSAVCRYSWLLTSSTGALRGASAFTQKTPPQQLMFRDAKAECDALARREQLLPAMVTGDRTVDAPPARDDLALRLRALVLLALCAGAVAWLVTR